MVAFPLGIYEGAVPGLMVGFARTTAGTTPGEPMQLRSQTSDDRRKASGRKADTGKKPPTFALEFIRTFPSVERQITAWLHILGK